MAKFITRIGHLKEPAFKQVGEIIKPGDDLGIMGTTGQTTILHGHIDTIRVDSFDDINKFPDQIWRVSDFEAGRVIAAPEQTDFLIGEKDDHGLFGCERKILHCYHDSGYTIAMKGKRHYGTDVDSTDPKKRIFKLNRSKNHKYKVLINKMDPRGGYGWLIAFGYEA